MTAWFDLPNYRLKKTYLASDGSWPLIFLADFKVGKFKNFVEKSSLFAAYFFCRNFARSSAKIIDEYDEAGFKTGLLYYTGWYKATDYIGVCRRNGQNYFTKHFKDREKAVAQMTNFEFANKYFSGSFLLPRHEQQKTIVFYKFVKRSTKTHNEERILHRMMYCAEKNSAAHGFLKPIASFIPDNMIYQLHQNNLHKLASQLEKKRAAFSEQVMCTPIHGDFTPWNVLIDTDNKVVLIDYERTGWHVFLYDCLHFILQPLAFSKNKKQIYPLLKNFFPEQEHNSLVNCCFVYLIDQIYHDLHDLQDYKNGNKFLERALAVKTWWLSSLLSEIDHVKAT